MQSRPPFNRHAPGTIYRRALRRNDRRARAYVAGGSQARDFALLVESTRLTNALAILAYGTPALATKSLLRGAPVRP